MKILKRFWKKYVPRYGAVYLFGLVCLLVTTAVTISVPPAIGNIIDLLRVEDLSLKVLQSKIHWLFLLGLALAVFRTLSRVSIFWPGRKIEQEIRQDYFNHLTQLPRSFYAKHTSGDLTSRGIRDVTAVRIMLSMGILHSVNTLVLSSGALYGMMKLSVGLTLWVLVPVLLMFVVTACVVKAVQKHVKKSQEALGALSENVRETFSAYQVLNTYPIHDQVMERFNEANEAYTSVNILLTKIRSIFFPLMPTFIGLGVLLVLWFGGNQVLSGTMALGSFVAFITYVGILAEPFIAIGWVVNAMQRGMSALERIFEIIDEPLTELLPANDPETDAPLLKVKNLKFNYPGFALEIDHIELKAGQFLGIFGSTSSGKTTLALLLAGILEAPAGTLYYKGRDIRSLSREERVKLVSFVPQDSFLFSESILRNISMTRDEKEARILSIEAIHFACLNADLEIFPQDIQTKLGEGGVTLSGGQRQRVSLARAKYHDGDIFILDDVTSSLDHTTESEILEHLYSELDDKAVVIVSHRITSLRDCHEIIILEEGKIVDRGTHEELYKRNHLYESAWNYERVEENVG